LKNIAANKNTNVQERERDGHAIAIVYFAESS